MTAADTPPTTAANNSNTSHATAAAVVEALHRRRRRRTVAVVAAAGWLVDHNLGEGGGDDAEPMLSLFTCLHTHPPAIVAAISRDLSITVT